MPKLTNEIIRKAHNELNAGFGFPQWVNQACVNCGKKLDPASFRGITLNTNAQYLGNISVNICCTTCSAGYETHYRLDCRNVTQFMTYLAAPSVECTIEPDFKIPAWDNNLVKIILKAERASTEESQPEKEKTNP